MRGGVVGKHYYGGGGGGGGADAGLTPELLRSLYGQKIGL
jgi:hypothetical protein